MSGDAKVTSTTSDVVVPTSHPKGFFFIFWGEFAERCSFYGMRAILLLYLTNVILVSKAPMEGAEQPDGAIAAASDPASVAAEKKRINDKANEISSYFKAGCYLMPLVGGFIADRFLGKYWTIVGFSVFYVIGQFTLLIPQTWALFIALSLLAFGSGVIKPNISTLLGLTYDQKRPGQLQLRTSGFMWFYFSVNIGALISQFGLPELRERVIRSTGDETWGFQVAFLLPAILMVAALIVFAVGKRHYATEVIGERHHLTPEEKRQRIKVLTTLFGVFALMVFFWMAYEQNDNLWILFAKENIAVDADQKIVPLRIGSWTWERSADGFQFINALCVITFIPLFTFIYAWFNRKGMPLRPMHKMLFGFFMTSMTWVVMSLAASNAAGGEKVSAWWLVGAYVVLTIGEVTVYGTGLELAFAAAPANMKSFITACFLLTNTGGNLLNAQFLKLYDKAIVLHPDDSWFKSLVKQGFLGVGIEHVTPTIFFLMTLGIMLSATVAFVFIGRKFERSSAEAAAVGVT